MARVVADMSMSLDGFVADPQDGVGKLFGWYGNGDVEIPTADPQYTFKVSPASAEHLRPALTGGVGALLAGRRIFDLTGGWGGRHPLGVPVFVVSHSVPDGWPRPDSDTTFYTDAFAALEAAKKEAGERIVAVSTPTLTRQYLDAGLLDEIVVSLVPVLLGSGIPFFGGLAKTPVGLGDPKVVAGQGVTHLTYPVIRERS
ncbi:dihydrofolate reductase family protein [Couchioplanes caeruleus]|uniref:Deaminase n=2 Tax=Couchioplanes caeruleus TaxID=56438 RepID=A0A1K0FH26_9ACTN|nr:dihydrofolate reductase family protein [Couchioplanes caeruleus]OJF12024.1 deaminase [Couchioplanes caeruleus subsp. caeruleus]ROP33184.1 dihydrofolate reductase [Couchioplanes caeruleus]